ncbi:MAG: hypothetical protein A2V52_03490 [Actinobacteria bacterium RBG_19FT_COMBO_54_7]|uniref:Uncharacterized protein n=1 Tax=Candidatus Solincola sediminis TaxID=1797199 RepID=A0A1F2WQC2_9ACTN|nr:MAG: hypothetical protein A2Y75_00735 [Candidatus Solincola sediminis]OFW66817.1 MAG: hypothetical protein A2V52_03490 [Actinobacteria bacterium RBG_19FT_COMBO_54_7]
MELVRNEFEMEEKHDAYDSVETFVMALVDELTKQEREAIYSAVGDLKADGKWSALWSRISMQMVCCILSGWAPWWDAPSISYPNTTGKRLRKS